MLVNIGVARKEPTDVVDLLLECHERIRSFTSLARRVADAQGVPQNELREAAGRVRRYFSEALPLHVADEERSIAPRVRGRSPAVDEALQRMSAQHTSHAPLLTRLLTLCAQLEDTPSQLGASADELRDLSEKLRAEFDAHLAIEEQVIFPALRQLLSDAERADIQRELRERRAS